MQLILRRSRIPKGTLSIGGDKSITHRSFIIASIAQGESVIHGYSRCVDCRSTLSIVEKLGISVQRYKDKIVIKGNGLDGLREPDNVLDCGNSGTTMRLFSGVLSGGDFYSVLTGDSSLRTRPMDRIIKPLNMMGADIQARGGGRFAPLGIQGRVLKSIYYTLPVASAQVKSAILLAGLYADGETVVEEPRATRDHTERMFSLFGTPVNRTGEKIILKKNRRLEASEVFIPGDISSAAYFIALGSIAKGAEILIKGVGVNPTRTGLLEVLNQMGADLKVMNSGVKSNEPVADLRIKNTRLKGIEISGSLIPRLIDEIPIIAVVATQAEGVTIVKDASELRVKETDRIKAVVCALKKMGAEIEERNAGFKVEGPTKLSGNLCTSYGDHRVAMALTIAGLIAEGVTKVDRAECINISFPEFITWARMVCGEECIVVEE
jgi:3-phosphoshikimate 1-carboxyvinyltransferase